jgi:hypothetical protein
MLPYIRAILRDREPLLHFQQTTAIGLMPVEHITDYIGGQRESPLVLSPQLGDRAAATLICETRELVNGQSSLSLRHSIECLGNPFSIPTLAWWLK